MQNRASLDSDGEASAMARTNGKKTPREDDLVALRATSASITTASVTIRTLRLNDRQLTLSVFRQLPKRHLINPETPELLGTVWGWVNYDCDSSPADKQFVAQFGDTLFRSPFWVRDVNRENFSDWPFQLQPHAEQYGMCGRYYILALAANGTLELTEKRRRFSQEKPDFTFPLAERPFFGSSVVEFSARNYHDGGAHSSLKGILCPEIERYMDSAAGTPRREPVPQTEVDAGIRKCKEHLNNLLRKHTANWDKPPEWWSAELDAIAARTEHYATCWNALMARLRTAEQLYIAS
jgi:hypothetical protein